MRPEPAADEWVTRGVFLPQGLRQLALEPKGNSVCSKFVTGFLLNFARGPERIQSGPLQLSTPREAAKEPPRTYQARGMRFSPTLRRASQRAIPPRQPRNAVYALPAVPLSAPTPPN